MINFLFNTVLPLGASKAYQTRLMWTVLYSNFNACFYEMKNAGNYMYDYAHSFFGKYFNPIRYTGKYNYLNFSFFHKKKSANLYHKRCPDCGFPTFVT